MKTTLGKHLSFYMGLAISLACIWWLFRSVDLGETLAYFARVRFGPILLAVLFTVLSYILRAWRWQFFFPNNVPTLKASYRCLILGFFMNNVLPARMGELVRAHLGGRATNLSRTLVLATIAGERLADGLMISLLFAVLFTLEASNSQLEQGQEMFYVALLFALAAGFVALLLAFRKTLYRVLEWISKRRSGRVSSFALERVYSFMEGLEPLLEPKRLFLIGVGSLIVWSVELLAYKFVAMSFNEELSLGFLSLFLAAVNFSSLIPAAPGGVGVIEAFATAALVHVGVTREAALAMVATQHVIQIAVVGIPGGWLFFHELRGRLPGRNLEQEFQEV